MQVGKLTFVFVLIAVLSGCGGGGTGGGNPPPPATETIGGFVNDLNNSPVTLLNNGTDKVTVPTFGSFTFPTAVASGSSYNVTVGKQPTNGQICQVQNGTGVATTNVTTVLVTCLGPFTLGGNVYGLSGSGLALEDNGGDTLQIHGNGPFQFSQPIPFGNSYSITVSAQPANPAQRCTVTNATGTPQNNVANILVSCASAEARWTWEGGSQSTSLAGIYGQLGVASPTNNPGARGGAVSWTDPDGNFWLFGGTNNNSEISNLNDLWKYSKGEWTWISGSSAGDNPAGVYGMQGKPDPANVPGARVNPVAWTDSSGSLWLFGGLGISATGQAFFNDLWRFSNNQWTWISGSDHPNQPPVYGTIGVGAPGNVPGARYDSMGWVDSSNTLWLFGGNDINILGAGGSTREQNDLWKFSNGQWTWVAGSNDPTSAPSGVYGTLGKPAAANAPGGREGGATWIDASGALWLFGGLGQDSTGAYGNLNDLWRFQDGQWTWMGGSKLVGHLGTFGTQGSPALGNIPSARYAADSWTDAAGNFWIFGGAGYDRSGGDGAFNDLWEYSGGEWTWVSGSQLALEPPSYGPLGVLSADSLPGGCTGKMSWVDKAGQFWVYCENNQDQQGLINSANDLWRYQP